jgi:hypothetical protein
MLADIHHKMNVSRICGVIFFPSISARLTATITIAAVRSSHYAAISNTVPCWILDT